MVFRRSLRCPRVPSAQEQFSNGRTVMHTWYPRARWTRQTQGANRTTFLNWKMHERTGQPGGKNKTNNRSLAGQAIGRPDPTGRPKLLAGQTLWFATTARQQSPGTARTVSNENRSAEPGIFSHGVLAKNKVQTRLMTGPTTKLGIPVEDKRHN